MQISTPRGNGTAAVENGSNEVEIASVNVNWTDVVEGNSWFSLIGETEIPFTIQTKTDLGGNLWRITLDGDYEGPTIAEADFIIHVWFTDPWHIPLMAPGDVQRSQLWNRAMWIIAANLGGGGGGTGGLGGLLVDFSISTTDKTKPSLWWKIVIEDSVTTVQWWLLQAGAPATGDVPTSDDATSRWRRVG